MVNLVFAVLFSLNFACFAREYYLTTRSSNTHLSFSSGTETWEFDSSKPTYLATDTLPISVRFSDKDNPIYYSKLESITVDSKVLYIISPIDDENSLPARGKIEIAACSALNNCESAKKTVNVKYVCNCENTQCPKVVTLYGPTTGIYVDIGNIVDSCKFVSRKFLYGNNFSNSKTIASDEHGSVFFGFGSTFSSGKYDWKINYELEKEVFSSQTSHMCLFTPISTDYIADKGALTVSVSTGVYLVKPEFEFVITAPPVPSGCSMSSKAEISFGSYSCSTVGTSDGKQNCAVPRTQTAIIDLERTIFDNNLSVVSKKIIQQTLYFINFDCSILEKTFDYENGKGTYKFQVRTHTGQKSDAIASETFSATNSSPRSGNIDDQRIITLQFTDTVKTSITLTLKKGTFEASKSFDFNISVIKNVIPTFTYAQDPAIAETDQSKLKIQVSNCCPNARVFVNFGATEKTSTTCSTEKTASFEIANTPDSQRYKICSSIGSSTKCTSENTFKMTYIKVDTTSSASAIAGYALSPRRELEITFKLSSVTITSVTANVGTFNKLLTGSSPGPYSATVTMETGGHYVVQYTVVISGKNYIFKGADFDCEYPNSPQIIPSKINYGLTEVNLNFLVKWNTPAGTHQLEYLKYNCHEFGEKVYNAKSFLETEDTTYLTEMSTIKNTDFNNLGNEHKRCTWSADVFNGFDHGIVSGFFHLGIDSCAQDKFNEITDFKFAESTCSGSFDDKFIYLVGGKAHASWKSSDTEQCEDEDDSMNVAFGTKQSKPVEFPFSSSYELSFPTSINNPYSIWITQLKGQDQSESHKETRNYCVLSNDSPKNPTISGTDIGVKGQTFYFKKSGVVSVDFTFGFPAFCEKDYDKYFLFTSKVAQGSVIQNSNTRILKFSTTDSKNHFIVDTSYTYCGFGTQKTYSKGITGFQFTNCMNGFENFGQNTDATFNCYYEYGCVVTLSKPLRLTPTGCDFEITYKISEKPYISVGNYFKLDYSKTEVKNVAVSYNLPEQTPQTENLKVKKFCSFVVKGPIDYYFSLGDKVFKDDFTLRKEDGLDNLQLSWKDGSEISPGCAMNPIFEINGIPKTSPYKVPALSMDRTSLSFNVKTVFSVNDSDSKQISTVSASSAFTRNICISESPVIEFIKCINCEESPSGVYNLYVPFLMLSIKIKKPGKSCIKENEYLQMQIMDGTEVLGTQMLSYKETYSLENSVNVKLNSKISTTLSLKLADYIITAPTINLCVVANMTSAPTLKSPKTQYLELTGKKIDVTIEINALKDLYSPCKNANAKYRIVGSRAYSTMKFEKEIKADASSSYTFKFTFENVGTYTYQIIAQDVLEREYVSDYYTINVCTNAENAPIPVQFEPIEDEIDVPVFMPIFSWEEFEPNSVALKCSSMHIAYIIVELEEANIFSETNTYSIKSSEISLAAKSITLPEELLLKIKTKYFWRLVVGSGTQSAPKTTPSEKPFSFTTVKKDCHYMDCHQGYCDEISLTCVCNNDYSGEYCDRVKGLTASEIGIIVAVVVVALIVILVIIFIILKRAQIFRLKMPDFTPYKFLMPKCIDSDNALNERDVIRHIEEDPDHDYEWAVNILNCTPLTEADNICRAFVYAFERNGLALDFLLHLIESEVNKAEQPSLLFRSNSISTKFFKSYSRLVGLPYLFRVLAPLLSKLLKDEKKAQDGVVLQGSSANAYINSKDASSILVENYELNPSMLGDSEFETTVESNALSIQLTCQMFLSSLDRTTSYCPFEFKRLCARIKKLVSVKFPDHKFELGLSSFIFLRFFVAGLTVPETFGIVEKPPSQNLRRQFILISKVLSNLSTNVKFGDKEDYMVIMNDFLESRKNALDSYYELLCNDDPTKVIDTVPIPDKFYNGSIEVIGVAAAKVSAHEWVPESSRTEPPSFQLY